jgi:hypothetical protein
VILRTDAVAANVYEMLLHNMNDLFEISPNDIVVVPLKLARTDQIKAVACIREQNKCLDETVSLPLVGVSFEALDYKIEVLLDADTHAGSTEPISGREILRRHSISVVPTSKSDTLGRFNFIVLKRKVDLVKAYLQTESPSIWHALPEHIRTKFAEKWIPHPRLTKGHNIGSTMSVMSTLTDLSTVDPRTGAVVNQWDKPPNLNPPPPSNIDALYLNQPTRDVDLSRLPPEARHTPTPATDAITLTSQQTLTEQLLVRNRVLERETDHQASQIQQLTTDLASLRTTLQDVISAFAWIEDRLPPPRPVEPPPHIESPPTTEDSQSKHPRQGDTPTRIAISKSTPSPVGHPPEVSDVAPMQVDDTFQMTEYVTQPNHAIRPTLSDWQIPAFSDDPNTTLSTSPVQKTVHDGVAFHDTITSENGRS